MTALIFQEGVRLGQKNDQNTQELMQQLGTQFGQLMYILDAFEDIEKDLYKGQFNPLALYFNADKTLEEVEFEQVRQLLLNLQKQVQQTISQLPITADQQELYSTRIASNLAMRIYKERTVPSTLRERIALRWENSRDFAFQVTCNTNSLARKLNYHLVSVAVFMAPQTTDYFPQDAKTEVFKWTAFLTALLASVGLLGVFSKKHREERRKKKNRKEKRQRKKFIKRIKAFSKSFKKLFSKKQDSLSCCDGCGGNGCSGDCCSGCCDGCSDAGCWATCCASCCTGCCGAMCESGCDSCTDGCCDPDKPWLWIFLVLLLLAIAAGVVLMILFI